MTKNLILCFSSLRPVGFSENMIQIREMNYDLALDWLLDSIPKNWDIIYSDNTIKNIDSIKNESLKNKLYNINVMLHNNNQGSVNKGAGEHDMCKKAFLSVDHEKYNWVTYFTARHIIPSSSYFDKLDREYKEFECIMSNPGFDYLLNYKHLSPAQSLYNDMLFSMKSNVFSSFVNSIDIKGLQNLNKNSERHLFEFVKNNKYKTHELSRLGILRNDHQSYGWHLV
jgi:hypothetical protein